MQDEQYNDLHVGTLVLLEGGHSTFLKGESPTDVAAAIEEARTHDYNFVWFQPNDRADNSISFDPNKVVALIRPQRRPNGAF